MSRRVYTIEDKKRLLKEALMLRARSNMSLPDAAKNIGVNQHTLTRWMRRYGNDKDVFMQASQEVAPGENLEQENLKLKLLIADMTRELADLRPKAVRRA